MCGWIMMLFGVLFFAVMFGPVGLIISAVLVVGAVVVGGMIGTAQHFSEQARQSPARSTKPRRRGKPEVEEEPEESDEPEPSEEYDEVYREKQKRLRAADARIKKLKSKRTKTPIKRKP